MDGTREKEFSMVGLTDTQQQLTPDDLAELMTTFQEVTLRLQHSQDQLTGEVHRLKRELREANDALERSRRLAALGEMAAGIAHEIRNPLAALSLDAATLASESELPSQREAAERIGRAVRTLNAIVQDVLHFASDTPVRIATHSVSELFARALEMCVVGPDVRIELGPWEAESADVDEHLLHRALVNVLRNAIEAMQETPVPVGGHRLRLASSLLNNGDVRLIIADTGPGIPESVVERMFNPFFTTRATGTGLGLAIVHRIVDAHGGRVEVIGERAGGAASGREPLVKGGAEVSLVLPRQDDSANAEAA